MVDFCINLSHTNQFMTEFCSTLFLDAEICGGVSYHNLYPMNRFVTDFCRTPLSCASLCDGMLFRDISVVNQ
jgi:hypothetical protein